MTENTTHALTADELKALRNADDVWFRHDRDGHTMIVARKSVDPGDGFGKRDLTVEIACEPKFTIYEKDLATGRTQPTSAFWSGAGKYSPEWQTALRLFKAGDRIILHWTGANNTERHRADGYTVDEFRVEIARTVETKARTKHERLVFLLGVQAVPPGGHRDIRFTD